MRSKLRRLRGLVQRYRTDRRLPPPVVDLLKRTTALRQHDVVQRRAASARPVLGRSDDAAGGDVARMGARRLHTVGPLTMSTHDLGHATATSVVDCLTAANVAPFVLERRGDGLVVGVRLPDRAAALSALASRPDARGWYVEWFDGSRTGIVPLADSRSDRRVRRARSWVVFQAHTWGDRAIGRDQGVEVSFWEIGTSGQFERVGTRGHDRFDPACAPTTARIDGHDYPSLTAFPVGADFEHVVDPIDIVYTWVDGSDPVWLDAFRTASADAGRSVDEIALDPARYRSRDELRYSLRSIWAYCGWVRKIWIVTAGQTPDWLVEDDRIRVVDHTEILPTSALPTFNSHAIEAALHHIDGLAEQFVYFNDDMFVGRPVRPELFFTSNGLARVFQGGARVEGAEDDDTLAVDTGARRGRELLAEHFGRVVTHKPYHAPYPLRRSTMAALEDRFTDIVRDTAHSRFRSASDLSVAASFAQHYGLATAQSVLGEIAAEYVHVESGRLQWHLDRIRLGHDTDAYCINETRDGLGVHDREQRIAEFFESVLPVAAPWEIPADRRDDA